MPSQQSIREDLFRIIFGTNTKAGRLFDVFLLWLILISVVVVVLESIPQLGAQYYTIFWTIESVLTALFTLEYLLRIYVTPRPRQYILSSWGLIDLMSIIPFYLELVLQGSHYMLVLRLFRLLRVFRILKLFRFLNEAQYLLSTLWAAAYKISVFLLGVLTIVIMLGTLMYVVEGPERNYISIPESIYWAIVTITTVGYGDITPSTTIGKIIASIIMLLGYAIIAIPTGIVTVEMAQRRTTSRVCTRCQKANTPDANYCNQCGQRLVLHFDEPGE